MMEQDWLERQDGGITAICRAWPVRNRELAQLFAAYASLPGSNNDIEGPFLQARTALIIQEVRDSLATDVSRSAYLERVCGHAIAECFKFAQQLGDDAVCRVAQICDTIERETAPGMAYVAAAEYMTPKLRRMLCRELLEAPLQVCARVWIARQHLGPRCAHQHGMVPQDLLQREGGMIALVRDGSRGSELAQLFTIYASLPECFDAIENAFLDATGVVCRENLEAAISHTSRTAYLEQVDART